MKLTLQTVPNPATNPELFVEIMNENAEAIEAAMENSVFRTGDTMEADLVLSGGTVSNGTIVEGEPNDGGGIPGFEVILGEHSISNVCNSNGGTVGGSTAGFVFSGTNFYLIGSPTNGESGGQLNIAIEIDDVDVTEDYFPAGVEYALPGGWCTGDPMEIGLDFRITSIGDYTPASPEDNTGGATFGEWQEYLGYFECLLNVSTFGSEDPPLDPYPGPKDASIKIEFRSTEGHVYAGFGTVHIYLAQIPE